MYYILESLNNHEVLGLAWPSSKVSSFKTHLHVGVVARQDSCDDRLELEHCIGEVVGAWRSVWIPADEGALQPEYVSSLDDIHCSQHTWVPVLS